MPRLVPIVEGDGEVTAVPEQLRRLLYDELEQYEWVVVKPKNAHGVGGLIKPGGIERFVQYALSEPDCSGVLVLLDGDAVGSIAPALRPDDCSPALAKFLTQRINELNPRVPIVVVIARWEYEAWFLASLETISPQFFSEETHFDGEVEEQRSPKGWLNARFPPGRKYSETRDQVRMTTIMQFDLVEQRSRSFKRLRDAIDEILQAHANGEGLVTPL